VVLTQTGLNSYMAAIVLYDANESWMGWSRAVVVLVWMISLVKNDEQVAGQISSDPQLILETRSRFILQSRRVVKILRDIPTLVLQM